MCNIRHVFYIILYKNKYRIYLNEKQNQPRFREIIFKKLSRFTVYITYLCHRLYNKYYYKLAYVLYAYNNIVDLIGMKTE